MKSALKSVPVLGQCLKVVRRIPKVLARISREIRHSVEGYRFLRTLDLLIVCGGGPIERRVGRSLAVSVWTLQVGCAGMGRGGESGWVSSNWFRPVLVFSVFD